MPNRRCHGSLWHWGTGEMRKPGANGFRLIRRFPQDLSFRVSFSDSRVVLGLPRRVLAERIARLAQFHGLVLNRLHLNTYHFRGSRLRFSTFSYTYTPYYVWDRYSFPFHVRRNIEILKCRGFTRYRPSSSRALVAGT